MTLWRQDVTLWPVISNSWFYESALSSWQRSYRQCDIQMSLPCHIGHTLRVLYPLYRKQSDWWVPSSIHSQVAWFKSKWGVPVPIQLIPTDRCLHIYVRQPMTIPVTFAEQEDPSRNARSLVLGRCLHHISAGTQSYHYWGFLWVSSFLAGKFHTSVLN